MHERRIRVRRKVEIPIDGPETPTFVTFDGFGKHEEHFALLFSGDSESKAPVPLVRVHSECLTGDVFHSKRCDCGAQLRYSIDAIGRQGGVLVYLRQEGRGIGLNAKIDAYDLQAKGYDTFAANLALGHPEDARDFTVAADMLKALGVEKIRLLTNNPEKVEGIKERGINIAEVLETPSFETSENIAYLRAKRDLHGHKIVQHDRAKG